MDLEWNGATTSEGYFNEIIEIGAVAMDDSMNVTGEFQSFVNPKHTKKLRGRIKELTHITNEDLKNAGGFISVFNRLKEWIGTTEDNCMLSWGNADITVLYENLERYRMLDEIYVINVGGYIGESTRREIEYAKKNGRVVRYLEPISK